MAVLAATAVRVVVDIMAVQAAMVDGAGVVPGDTTTFTSMRAGTFLSMAASKPTAVRVATVGRAGLEIGRAQAAMVARVDGAGKSIYMAAVLH